MATTEYSDPITGAQLTIDVAHYEVHEGDYFSVFKYAEGVADDGTQEILLVTTDKKCHIFVEAGSTGLAVLTITEGVTVTAAGTGLTENNMNRFSSNTATAVATHTPTLADGTVIHTHLIPAGKQAGSSVRNGAEWIFKANANYGIKIKNLAGNAQAMGLVVEWYEHR